jgi:hypothetical protein
MVNPMIFLVPRSVDLVLSRGFPRTHLASFSPVTFVEAMANLVAGGLLSLRVHMEEEGGGSEHIIEAWEAVYGLKLRNLSVPMPSGPGPAGPGSFKDLPIVPLLPAQQNATHIIEVITDCDVKFNLDSVKKLMANSQYDELPSPLKPKAKLEVGYTMQLAIVPQEGAPDKDIIIKHYKFTKPIGVDVFKSRLQQADGILFALDKTTDWFRGFMVFQLLFERLGGLRFTYYAWPTQQVGRDKTKKLKSQDEIRAAYQFMKDEGPRTNGDCEQNIWVDIQMNDPDSPCFYMDKGTMFKALEKYSEGSNLVKVQRYYPLFLSDISKQGLVILAMLLPLFLNSTLLLVGEGGHAKTPYCVIIAMALARWWSKRNGGKVAPGYRIAPDMDFFRGEPGCPEAIRHGKLINT